MAKEKGQVIFMWLDYTIFVATVLLSLAIGLYQAFTSRRRLTTDEYLMGNRNMSMFPVAVSLTVSFLSAISILGYPVEIYYFGSTFLFIIVGGLLGVLTAVYFFIPVLYPLRMTSINEVGVLID